VRGCNDVIEDGIPLAFLDMFAAVKGGSKRWIVVDKGSYPSVALPLAENDKEAGATGTSNKALRRTMVSFAK
jgi:hypothetical protein